MLIRIAAAVLVALSLLSQICCGGCVTPEAYINPELGLSLTGAGSEIRFNNTHDGFHSDGESFYVIRLADAEAERIETDLAKRTDWSKLPNDALTQAFIFGGECDGTDYYGIFESIHHNAPEGMFEAELQNGYYIFVDRFAANYPDEADVPLNKRPAHNFTYAAYDSNAKTLFVFEFDS